MSLPFGHFEQVLELLDLGVDRCSLSFNLPANQTGVLVGASGARHNLIHLLRRTRPLTSQLVAIFRWTVCFGYVLHT